MNFKYFIMQLMHIDTKRATNSDIFINQALDEYPQFWGWPNKFIINNNKKHILERCCSIIISPQKEKIKEKVRLWFRGKENNPTERIEFRLTCSTLHNAGEENDLLLFSISSNDYEVDYEIELIKQDDPKYDFLKQKINSGKRRKWGYFCKITE